MVSYKITCKVRKEKNLLYCNKEVFQKMVGMRRDLHRIPEIAFNEFKTSEYVCNRLKELGIEYKIIAKTGVVGLIRGKEGGKNLLLRADMDALPVTEITDSEYKSTHEGMMHACGHDFHTAALLGTAQVLCELKNDFYGNVKLVFQPAEEGVGGAVPMIKEGVMQNPEVDAAAALHVWPELECGCVELRSGGMSASSDHFNITVTGKSGHAAYPHKCINPIVIAGRIADEITKLTDMKNERLVSVTYISGGNCHNIIPESVTLGGTCRTTSPQSRTELEALIKEVCDRECKKMCGKGDVEFKRRYPPVMNDENLTRMFCTSAAKTLGEDKVLFMKEASMIGEDFSYFGELVPAVFVHLGAKPKDAEQIYPLHNPLVKFDENCLETACNSLVGLALEYLKEEK